MAGQMVEVRWHARGGQGAKTAAMFLAEAVLEKGKFGRPWRAMVKAIESAQKSGNLISFEQAKQWGLKRQNEKQVKSAIMNKRARIA